MTLSQAEAEKLAREIKQWATVLSDTKRYEQICGVCDHILSGSMKREIENAALRDDLLETLTNAGQLIDSAHLNGKDLSANWTEWDNQVRNKIGKLLERLYAL